MITYTLEQYTALKDAIAIGATRVRYGDKDVEYRSLADMMKLKAAMEAELFPSASKSKNANKRKYADYERGF